MFRQSVSVRVSAWAAVCPATVSAQSTSVVVQPWGDMAWRRPVGKKKMGGQPKCAMNFSELPPLVLQEVFCAFEVHSHPQFVLGRICKHFWRICQTAIVQQALRLFAPKASAALASEFEDGSGSEFEDASGSLGETWPGSESLHLC